MTNFLSDNATFKPGGGGGGGVNQVDTGTGLTGGPITDTGTISLANVPTGTVKGRLLAGTGAPTDLTGTQATTLLDVFTTSLKGVVPASGGGTTNFLRADGAFAAPPGGGTISLPSFASVADAQKASIPGSSNSIQIFGYNSPGDNGGGIYKKVSSLPSEYVGDGSGITPIPPSMVSGGLPINVFSTTATNKQNLFHGFGPTSAQIASGNLAILVLFALDSQGSPLTQPSTITDSVGNTYVLGIHGEGTTSGYIHSVSLYYCASPTFAVPIGSSFNVNANGNNPNAYINVYTVPGFTGAVLDQASSLNLNAGGFTGSSSITSGALTLSTPQMVFGVVMGVPATAQTSYTYPVGWNDLSPQINERNPIACNVVNSASPITFNVSWLIGSSIANPTSLIATFSQSPVAAISPFFWELSATLPVHTAQYGIDPTAPENAFSFINFSRWLASISAPSGTSIGGIQNVSGTCTIDIASGDITLIPGTSEWHNLHAGQMVSFSTTGVLPIDTATGLPLVPGKRYFIQYKSVTLTTVKISVTSIFGGNQGGQTTAKGVPITFSGSQSGTHSYTTYGESWTDFFLDPGIYYASLSVLPGQNVGLKKWRLFGYGARMQTGFQLGGAAANDINANTAGSTLAFMAQFKTTSPVGSWPNSITLVSPSLAPNFHCFSWVILLCNELQIGVVGGSANWNEHTFEYLRLQTNNVSQISSGTYNTSTHAIVVVVGSLGVPAITAGQLAGLSSLTGTGAFASLNGDWTISTIVGTGPYTITLQGPTVAASTITGGSFCTGILTFFDNIQYNYDSTFPKFAPGGGTWPGAITGPATIVQTADTFDQEIEIHGLSIGTGNQEMGCFGAASVKLVDCEIFGWGFKTGPFPSTIKNFTMERCRIRNAAQEVDKLIDTLNYIDCEWDYGLITTAGGNNQNQVLFQSSSINKTTFTRCKLTGIAGISKDVTIRDCRITGQFTLGVVFGVTERVLIENTHIQSMNSAPAGGEVVSLNNPNVGFGTGVTFVNGTLKVAPGTLGWQGSSTFSGNPLYWAVPNGKIMVCSDAMDSTIFTTAAAAMVTAFTIYRVYTDGSDNYCVDTDLASFPSSAITVTGTMSGTTLTVATINPSDAVLLNGMVITATAGGTLPANTTILTTPGIPNSSIGTYTLSNAPASGAPTSFTAVPNLYFVQHPCPRLTVVNCTGGRSITDMAGVPPDIPMYSYFKRQFAGFPIAINAGNTTQINLAGKLISWTIDVAKPYTGASGTYTATIVMFGWKVASGNYYPTFLSQVVNLKVAGVRTITSAAPTTVGLSGDTLVPVPFWLTGGHVVFTGSSSGGDTLVNMPAFLMTAQANQGIDFAGLVINTAAGINEFADSVMQATIN